LDSTVGPIASFAIDLRRLRFAAGNISYRALAKRAHFSHSVLSAATSGFSLPTLRVTLAFVEACGGDRAEWERRWWEVAQTAGAAVDQDMTPGRSDEAVIDRPVDRPPSGPTGPAASPSAGPSAMPTPAQLPAGSRHFAGRWGELAALDKLTQPDGVAGTVPVLLSGPVGAGKSSLAVHWIHQSRSRYCDGVLYADLGGGGRGVAPQRVLTDFLRALGTPPDLIPSDAGQCAALYRSVLAERAALVLLDNAVNEAQLRLLLAEAPGSQVIITSRSRLAGLDGIDRLPLGTLPPEQSLAVLSAIIGDGDVAANRELALELAELCDHLPLALRLVAVRIAVRPGWTLAHAVDHLRDHTRRIDQLRSGDIDLRCRLRAAYRDLDAMPRLSLRLLAQLRQPDHTARVLASSLLDVPVRVAEELMETLVDAGLLQPTETAGTYRLPELFRLCAREVAESEAGGTQALLEVGGGSGC
jgi:hypothetical protein